MTRLKELLGMIPKKELKAEEIKIEEEIAVVETAEEMLESDLNHMKHTKHTSADREKLEVEIDAMKKLDSDLVKQNEVIQDIIEEDEKDLEYEYKKSEEWSEQSDFKDFEEYSRDYMDNSKSRSDEYSSDSDDTYGSKYEDDSDNSDSTSDYDDFTDRNKRTVDGKKKKNHCHKWYRINKKKLMEEEKKKNMVEKENKKNMVEKEEKKKMMEKKEKKIMEKEEKKKMMEKKEKKKMMEKKEKKKMMEKKEMKKMMEKEEKKKMMKKKEKNMVKKENKKMMEKEKKKSMVEKKEKEDKKNSISKSLSDDKSDDKNRMLTLDVIASLYNPSSDKIEVHSRRKQREIDTTHMDIRSLIRRVLTGVSKAGKGEGLSVTEAQDLQKDIWSLEQKENEIVKDLMGVANGGKQ